MNKNIGLIILHSNDTPEIVASLENEAVSRHINCVNIDEDTNLDDLELPNNFYLFYSILNVEASRPYISALSEKCRLIHYTTGRQAIVSHWNQLKHHEIPYVSIRDHNNMDLLTKIEDMGGFPVLFSSSQFSNSKGKYYIENKDIFLQVINTIRNREKFDYILKYIEHDFHVRVYIINYHYNSAVIYYKDNNDYTTNRLDIGKRNKMSFSNNISPKIIQIAVNYAKYLHVETAGVDILVSKNNEFYILEANNPMMYHAVPESLPIVSRGIIQGLLDKYEVALSNKISRKDSIQLLPSTQSFSNKQYHSDVLFTTQQKKLSLINEYTVPENKKVMVLNSRYCQKYLAYIDTIFGYNSYVNALIPKRHIEYLEKNNIYVWQKYTLPTVIPNKLQSKALEQNCSFPAIFKVEESNGYIQYLKVNTPKQGLSILSMYQYTKHQCAIYPYIYTYVKRKVLLVGDKVIAIIEYIPEANNPNTIFSSNNAIKIDLNDISEQEFSAFKTISELLLFQGAWTLEYIVDIQSKFHIMSYDNGYNLDDFNSSTSDLLMVKIINQLYLAYKSQELSPSLYNSILSLDNIFQKFHLLYAYHMGMRIESLYDSIYYADVTFKGITHRISNCFFGQIDLPESAQATLDNILSLNEYLSNSLTEYLIPTVVIEDDAIIDKQMLREKISQLNFPLIIKESNGSRFEVVYSHIDTIEKLTDKVFLLKKGGNKILIQEMLSGPEYSIFMVDNKIVAVAMRQPATLIGNGHAPISDLIETFNQHYIDYQNPNLIDSPYNFGITPDTPHHNFIHAPEIIINKQLLEYLELFSYDLDTVLDKNQTFSFPPAVSFGDSWKDETKNFPKKIARKLVKINQSSGIKINSFNIIVSDTGEFKIIDFNLFPSTILHHFVTSGSPQPVIQKIFSYLFKINK